MNRFDEDQSWRGISGLRARHTNDGDAHVYIKTDWLSIAVTCLLLIGLGFALARCTA